MPTNAAAIARMVSSTLAGRAEAIMGAAGRGTAAGAVARATGAAAATGAAVARGAAGAACPGLLAMAGAGAPGAEAPADGPPGGSVGSLMVGAADGFGGKLIRTVSFLG